MVPSRILIIGATLALWLILPLTAQARPVDGSARKAALVGGDVGLTGGAELLKDHSDIFTFPQLSPQYRNLAHVSMGLDTGDGDALLLFGNERATFGLALHSDTNLLAPAPRPGQEDAEEGEVTHTGFSTLSGLHNLADILFGLKLDNGLLGASLSLAFDNASQVVGTEDGNVSNSESGYGLGLKAGYSQESWDAALALDIQSITSEAVDTAEGFALGFGARGRGRIDWREGVELGWMAGLDITSRTVRLDKEGGGVDETSGTEWSLFGAFGPVYELEKRAEIGAYGLVRVGGTSGQNMLSGSTALGTCAAGQECETSTTIIPGVQLGGEYWIEDWINVRAGAQYTWTTRGEKLLVDEVAPNTVIERGDNEGAFGWSAGVGLKLEDFRFDGHLQDTWLTEGPVFLGSDKGLFAGVSTSYQF